MVNYSDDYWKDVREVLACVPHVEKLYNKSILITGATGMICSSVAELLFELNRNEGSNIKIYLAGRSLQRMQQRFYCFTEDVDYTFVEYDATSGNAINILPDFIIHGASPADPASLANLPVETIYSNIIGLKPLLELCKKEKGTRLLYVSSSEVYGKKDSPDPYKELDYGYVDILNPRACYPSSKRASETLCAAYKQECEVDFVIVRPGHIYGPTITDSDSRASAQFSRLAAQGKDIVMKSAGTQLRSYTYAMDCASAILTVLLEGNSGEAYNISNPDSIVSIRELAECIAEVAGVNVFFEQASSKEQRSYNMMDNSSLYSKKLESLGWRGLFNLERGVNHTLNCFSYE